MWVKGKLTRCGCVLRRSQKGKALVPRYTDDNFPSLQRALTQAAWGRGGILQGQENSTTREPVGQKGWQGIKMEIEFHRLLHDSIQEFLK